MGKVKICLLFTALIIFNLGCKEMGDDKPATTPINKQDSVITTAQVKKSLTEKGYEIFDYVDAKSGDTVLMQQYFMAFLKKGPVRTQSKKVADSLQTLHRNHLGRMYELGYADIRGITIYNTPTQEIADSLANLDPMVQSGRLIIEMHPWWAAKGFPLR